MLMPGYTSTKMLLREYTTIVQVPSTTGLCHLLTIKQDWDSCLDLRHAQDSTEKIASIALNVVAMIECLLEKNYCSIKIIYYQSLF
jgi:hypothetical protein